jgi:hypothetical protein
VVVRSGSGTVEPWSEDLADDVDERHPEERGLIPIEPEPSGAAWQDMADYTAGVPFKDELLEYPHLREAWFAFADARMERRALRWLAGKGLIDDAVAERAIAQRPDPPPPASAGDRFALARAVADDLRTLFGDRLQRVLVFGSSARGDADPESDLDLLVVLDDMRSAWDEGARMDDVLWRHTLESGIVVSALPVRAAELEPPTRPVLIRALADGVEP